MLLIISEIYLFLFRIPVNYGMSTSFVRKGRVAKDEPLRKVLRSELSKERVTRLEGSFGTQKQHYSLSRIKDGIGKRKSYGFSSEYIR